MAEVVLPPFLVWAGGKRWLAQSGIEIQLEPGKKYIEPFLGSAAVYFHTRPQAALLSDSNAWLIETYNAIKYDWEMVESELAKHHKKHSKDYYYEMRGKKFLTSQTRAAQFIYLNRTCWNGLFRVNLSGKFNVPIGTKNAIVRDTDNFEGISKLFSNAEIIHSDFEPSINEAAHGDVVYADPPYTVKHNQNGFIKYNEKLFSWEDQERLHAVLLNAKQRGAKVIVSNASHPSIRELYQDDFDVQVRDRKSVLSGKSEFRGKTQEILAFS